MLLDLGSREWIRKPFLEGYITSAGAGSESLVQATRAALAACVEGSQQELRTTLMVSLKTTVIVSFPSELVSVDCKGNGPSVDLFLACHSLSMALLFGTMPFV